MKPQISIIRHLGVMALLLTFGLDSSNSATLTWIGGNGGVWDADQGKWSPADEPDPDDDVHLFGSSLTLGINNMVNSVLQNGSNGFLGTEQYSLAILDNLTIAGGAVFQATANDTANKPAVSAQLADTLVGTNGKFEMANTVWVAKSSGNALFHIFNGELHGNGHLFFVDSLASETTVFENEGKLTVGNVANFPLLGTPPARTLRLSANDSDAAFDLSGQDLSGTVDVRRNATLDIDGEIETFRGTMTLRHNSSFDASEGWWLGRLTEGPGTLVVDNGFVPGNPGLLIPSVPADTAYIKGQTFIIDNPNSLVDMVDTDGGLTIDSQLFATFGAIQHRGTLTINTDSLIGSGFNFQNDNQSHLVLNAELIVGDHDWDWDSTGSARQLTINGGGSLETNFQGAGADDMWSANMQINGGLLSVGTQDGSWGQNAGTITIGPSTGADPSRITGSVFFDQTNGSLVVESGGEFEMLTQSHWGATLQVDGEARLKNDIQWKGGNITGTGTLVQQADAQATSNTTIGVSKFKWDGGDTTVAPGVTLTVDVDNIDYTDNIYNNATINVNSGVLDVTVANGTWELFNNGVVNLSNSGGGTPTISGSRLRTGGSGQVRVEGVATITAPLWIGSGINGNSTDGVMITGSGGVLNIFGPSLLLDGGNIRDNIDRSLFNTQVNLFAPMTVTQESIVDVETFDWDGNSTTVDQLGVFRMLSDRIEVAGVQQYDNTLTLNGGQAEIDLGAFASWTLNHVLNLNHSAGYTPVLSGDHVQIGNDNSTPRTFVNVDGGGDSIIEANVTYMSDAELSVAAGSTLIHRGNVTFESENGNDSADFNGPGSLILGGTNTVNEFTHLDMSGGVVDLDNSSISAFAANNTYLNDALLIEAAEMADYGHSKFIGQQTYSELFIADEGQLSVQLDGVGNEWTVNSVGIIHYNGNSTANTFLSGDAINMNGELNVTGYGASSAQMNIAGTVNITSTGTGFRLSGGSLADPNRLAGGTINGVNGILSTSNNRHLLGYGVINSDVEFLGNTARLLADDGEMILNGDILDVGILGTADVDGILNVSNPWNTQVADQVVLQGGSVTGALITNSGANGISGFGDIDANVTNHTKIVAENGVLTLNNPTASSLGSGLFHAQTGDLVIHYGSPTSALFAGEIRAEAGQEVFADNFQMLLTASAEIDLNGGKFRTNRDTTLVGTLNTIGGLTSSVETTEVFTFNSGSNTQLNGDLELIGATEVANGATFAGSGSLINTAGSSLNLANGAVLGVVVENHGMMTIGDSPGQADAVGFIQGDSGEWAIELGDTGASDFDSLALSGSAQLDGTLTVSLLNNFMPVLGDEFAIISAGAGLSGAFDALEFSSLPSGLTFDIAYELNDVILQVVAGLSGDFDVDDDVDGFDFLTWQRGGSPNPLSESDLNDWQENYGLSNSLSAATASAVPEPGTALLIVLGSLALGLRIERRLR